MPGQRLSLNQSLWVCGRSIAQNNNRHARREVAALRERGAEVFLFNGRGDPENFEQLRQRLRQKDDHVILMWLHPGEMRALQPIFQERKNFSVVLDDWWIIPHWFIREAEYKIFRKYNGVAVRLGKANFVDGTPPLFTRPEPISPFSAGAALARLPALALSPFIDFYKGFQRRGETVRPETLLYFPFPIFPEDVPLKTEKIEYDFSISGSTCGVWLMRDAFAPFRYTYANLYYDRQRLMDGIACFDGKPFKVHDWRRLKENAHPPLDWEEYLRVSRQTRFIVSTGGLHNACVPKFLEYACLGTPMIGRKLPFEYPWLDDCLFPVDILRLTPEQLKPLLHEAVERYPVFRENCLRWRDRIIELYDIHRLLDLTQAQADGKPVLPGYLRADLKNPSVENLIRA